MDATEMQPWQKCHILNSLKILNEQREDGRFCDLTLRSVDNIEIPVHKAVLYSASGYYRSMFTSQMEESFSNCVEERVTGKILEKIVSFMYLGSLENEKLNDIEEIAKYAQYFQLEHLTNACTIVLSENINDHTCLNYWRLSKNHLLDVLESICYKYILKSVNNLFQNDSFLKALTLEEMKELVESEQLAGTEEFIFESALKWARSTNDFVNNFSEVMDFIRSALFTKEFVSSKVLGIKELKENQIFLKKLIEWTQYRWNEESSNSPIFSKRTMPRIGLGEKGLLAVCGDAVIQVSEKGRLSHFSKRTSDRENFGYTTFLDNYLLLCGGQWKSSCEYFSPITKEWKPFPDMKAKRSRHSCAFIDNNIYACGGTEQSKSVEIFDLSTGKWDIGVEMEYKRRNFGLTSLNRSLYAVAGCKNSSIENFDPRMSIGWNTVSYGWGNPRNTKCVSYDYKIYCFTSNNENYIFDTRTNKCETWNCITPCTISHSSFDVCKLDGRIGLFLLENVNSSYHNVPLYNSYFYKYNFNGENTLTGTLGGVSSSRTTALVALYY